MRTARPSRTPTFLSLALALAGLLMGAGCESSPWDEHDAHRWCRPALRDAPGAPELTCDGLHMCANEVTLNERDTARFDAAMERLGCEPP
ncbi:MAG: hypothetical protein AB8I08_10855 [Sandaracinaceae bacterium]